MQVSSGEAALGAKLGAGTARICTAVTAAGSATQSPPAGVALLAHAGGCGMVEAGGGSEREKAPSGRAVQVSVSDSTGAGGTGRENTASAASSGAEYMAAAGGAGASAGGGAPLAGAGHAGTSRGAAQPSGRCKHE